MSKDRILTLTTTMTTTNQYRQARATFLEKTKEKKELETKKEELTKALKENSVLEEELNKYFESEEWKELESKNKEAESLIEQLMKSIGKTQEEAEDIVYGVEEASTPNQAPETLNHPHTVEYYATSLLGNGLLSLEEEKGDGYINKEVNGVKRTYINSNALHTKLVGGETAVK
jgi:hypothetical protein